MTFHGKKITKILSIFQSQGFLIHVERSGSEKPFTCDDSAFLKIEPFPIFARVLQGFWSASLPRNPWRSGVDQNFLASEDGTGQEHPEVIN